LDSEAIDDNEISPLRDYVSAGGFLFIGSSAFTPVSRGGVTAAISSWLLKWDYAWPIPNLTESNNLELRLRTGISPRVPPIG